MQQRQKVDRNAVRYLGIVLIALSFAGGGVAAAARVKKRCLSLGSIISFLKIFSVELGFAMSETGVLVQSAAAKMESPPCFIESFGEFAEKVENLPEAWKKAVLKHKSDLCLKQNELETVLQLGGIFGNYDAAGQMSAINAAEIQISEMYSSAQSECEQKARLCRTFGMLAGAAAAIILV